MHSSGSAASIETPPTPIIRANIIAEWLHGYKRSWSNIAILLSGDKSRSFTEDDVSDLFIRYAEAADNTT